MDAVSLILPADFLDLGAREAADIALDGLGRKGTIRRLARGVYDFPKEHPVLGPLLASAETVAPAQRNVSPVIPENSHVGH